MSKLLKNTILYTIGSILPQIANFVLLPLYTNYLSPSDYGIVNSMNVLSAIMLIVFTLAIERGIYRLYYDFNNDNEKRNYLGTITIFVLISSIAAVIFLFFFRNHVENIYTSIPFNPYYSLIIFTTFFTTFSIVPKIYFQVKEKANAFVVISLLQFVFLTGFTILEVVWLKKGAVGMLEGNLFANMIIAPVFIILSYKFINISFDWSLLKKSLQFSLPLLPAISMGWILNFSDRVFIERFLTLDDVGIYSLGYKIGSLTSIIAGGFFTAYSPTFYRLANSENQIEAKSQIYNLNSRFLIVILSIAFLIAFFSKEAIVLFFPGQYHASASVIPIISFAFFFNQTSGLFNLMIYQQKKTLIIMIIIIIGAGVNILMNYLLIPRMGYVGSAYAALISFSCLSALNYVYAKKCYFIPLNWSLLPFILILFILIYFVFTFVSDSNIILSLILKGLLLSLGLIYLIKKHSVKLLTLIKFKESNNDK